MADKSRDRLVLAFEGESLDAADSEEEVELAGFDETVDVLVEVFGDVLLFGEVLEVDEFFAEVLEELEQVSVVAQELDRRPLSGVLQEGEVEEEDGQEFVCDGRPQRLDLVDVADDHLVQQCEDEAVLREEAADESESGVDELLGQRLVADVRRVLE